METVWRVQGFPYDVYTCGGGDLSPPYGGEQMQGDKALMGGLMRGDLTLIDYIITVFVKLQLHDAIYRLRFY